MVKKVGFQLLHMTLCLCVLLLQAWPALSWLQGVQTPLQKTSATMKRGEWMMQQEQQTCAPSRTGPLSMTATTATKTKEEEDDDDEWEYVEFDRLLETDLIGSEWLVGTLLDEDNKNIQETWCRLVTNPDNGKNIAVWGDDAKGTWSLDVASQYLTISKNSLWGKRIWACLVDDYYYLQGAVRQWSFITPASVAGQWQARRLGVDPEEAGVAPWFAKQEEEKAQEAPTTETTSETTTEEKDSN